MLPVLSQTKKMAAALKEVFQYAFSQGEFEMAGIVDISEAEDGQGFLTSR